MLKPGCVPPTIYWRYPNGHLVVAPFSECPTPEGAIREEADTLPEVRALEKKLVQQEIEELEKEQKADYERCMEAKRRIRDRLVARCTSSATSEIEKEYIRGILALQDERKVKYYNQRFLEHQTFHFHALHFDLGKRDASVEVFDPNRLEQSDVT
jgi:hypothetical protein